MRTTAEYKIGSDNEFIIENYNYAKAFSSFLPGIAGVHLVEAGKSLYGLAKPHKYKRAETALARA